MAKSKAVRIEYKPLAEVLRWPANPKLHDLDGLETAFRRFGFVTPPIVNEATGELVTGHGRVEALERRRSAGMSPPERIKLDADGGWLVPLVYGIAFDDPDEAARYAIGDNRLVELGGWDQSLLQELVVELVESMGDRALDGLGMLPGEVGVFLDAADLPDVVPIGPDIANDVEFVRCPKCKSWFPK